MGPWEPAWPSPSACSPRLSPAATRGAQESHHLLNHHTTTTTCRTHRPVQSLNLHPQFATDKPPDRPIPYHKRKGASATEPSLHPPTRALCKTPTASPFSGYPCAWAIRRPNPHRPVNTSPTRPAGYAKTRHMQGTVCGPLNSFSKRVPLLFNNARLPCMQEAEPSQHDMSMNALPWQPWEQNRGAARAASPTAGLPAPANCVHGWPPAPGHTCSQPFPDQP